jgi:GDP-L-fucose synthase
MLEVQSRLFRAAHGCNFVSVIPTNIYGTHDQFNLEKSHVIPGLIHKCYLAQRDGTPFTVAGSGTPLRQFLFAPDLARLLLVVMTSYNEAEPLILAPDASEEVSIKTVAEGVASAMGFTGAIVWDASKPDGQHRKTAANGRLRALLPDALPDGFTPLAKGLAETVSWFKAAFPHVRQ